MRLEVINTLLVKNQNALHNYKTFKGAPSNSYIIYLQMFIFYIHFDTAALSLVESIILQYYREATECKQRLDRFRLKHLKDVSIHLHGFCCLVTSTPFEALF